VFIQYNEARLEIFIKLSSKTHAAITNYLGCVDKEDSQIA